MATIIAETSSAGVSAVLAPPDEIQPSALAATNTTGDDPSSAPEEASDSEIPGDPRPPHALQPPTAEEY